MAETLKFRGGNTIDVNSGATTVSTREIVIDTDTDQIVSGPSKLRTVMEDSSGNISIDGTAVFAGKVGVGSTSTPPDDFSVTSTASRTTLSLNADSGQDTRLSFKRSGTYRFNFINDSTDNFSIQNSSFNSIISFNTAGTVGIGGTLPSSPNIELNADGSADFAGIATVGSMSTGSTTSSGVRLGLGYAYIQRPANSSSVVQRTYQGSTVTYELNANGSAEFAYNVAVGNIDLTGSGTSGSLVQNNGTIKLIKSNANEAFSVSNGTTKNVSITAGGSAEFASDVKIGGTLPSAPNISLNANGDAQYSGKIGINRAPSTVTWLGIDMPDVDSNYGVYVRTATTSATNRYAFATGNRGSTGATGIWYTQGDLKIGTNLDSPASVEKISLNADGSAEFTGDITCTDNSKGLILKSPDGTSFRLSVANDGTLSASSI